MLDDRELEKEDDDEGGMSLSEPSGSEDEGEPAVMGTSNQGRSNGDSGNSNGSGVLAPTANPSQLHQNYFAPPYYGRPPTPLPPSPSLTSLLRPSRPTTPDASDDDHPNPLAEPIARSTPKVPTYEYYGFVLYLFSSLTFLIYLLWAYLPSYILHALGIFYYPNRWWALAIPAWLVMLIVYIYVALAALNTEVLTLPLTSLETVVDEAGNIALVDFKGKAKNIRGSASLGPGEADSSKRRVWADKEARELDWKTLWSEGTDAVMDVPLAGVNEVLYGYDEPDTSFSGELDFHD